MKPSESPTIDDIKKAYEYKLDPFDFIDTPIVIFCLKYRHFEEEFNKYEFDKNINEIKKYIDKKRDQIDKKVLESYEKTLNEISEGCEKITKRVQLDYKEVGDIIGAIAYDYDKYINKPGAPDIYLKINRDILDKEMNLFIHYQKLLILYNEQIYSIKKKLYN